MKGLSGIIGQAHAVRVLRSAIAQARVASAYLFEGAPGVGKATCARGLAQAWNCDVDPNGCGECVSCSKIAGDAHPDVSFIVPDGQMIKIAQVRQVTARAAFAPHEAHVRVVILDPADALNIEAGNALLKTLEEPPLHTRFVLVTGAPERLPVTVRSRCQRVRFVPLRASDIAQVLVERDGLAADAARDAARLAGGSLARARELGTSGGFETQRQHVRALSDAVAGRGFGPVLDAAARLKDQKEDLPVGLALLRALYRDALLFALGAADGRAVHDRAEVGALPDLGATTLRRRIDAVLAAEEALRANVSPQLCLEHLMLRLRAC
jgi:DNA polymerase-3 subunit delta'